MDENNVAVLAIETEQTIISTFDHFLVA